MLILRFILVLAASTFLTAGLSWAKPNQGPGGSGGTEPGEMSQPPDSPNLDQKKRDREILLNGGSQPIRN